MNFRCVLACGLLLITRAALGDIPPTRGPAVVPRKAEAAKVVLPVQMKVADLSGEGDGVKYKLTLPAKMQAGAEGKKMGAIESVSPSQRSVVAAIALSLAAVSVVFVFRGKKLSTGAKGTILGIAALVSAAGIAYGNAPPPPPRPKPVPPAPAGKATIVIEYSADVEEAVLTIGK
jgi:hypothetical protein